MPGTTGVECELVPGTDCDDEFLRGHAELHQKSGSVPGTIRSRDLARSRSVPGTIPESYRIARRELAVRQYQVPSTSAGDASVCSPSSLVRSSLN